MTDMLMSRRTQPAGALPSSIDIDAEITALEVHLARLVATRDARPAEDTTPWVFDHSDDRWRGSGAVGPSAFSRLTGHGMQFDDLQ